MPFTTKYLHYAVSVFQIACNGVDERKRQRRSSVGAERSSRGGGSIGCREGEQWLAYGLMD